jgi:hypothetical protein
MIHHADDWFAQGYRIMAARDIYPGDSYLMSYVERTIANTCQEREDLHNGYIDVDGNYLLAEQVFWVKKNDA